MRDLIVLVLVGLSCILALRKPWIGVLAWSWVSVMNPHKYAWGLAYDAPLAMAIAVCTLLGMAFTSDRGSPIPERPMAWFAVLTLWITISWLMGFNVEANYDQWIRVMKINLMIFVTAALVRTQFQLNAFIIVCAFSLALLGAKGGLFVFATGGSYRVWGPPTSYVNGNNEFAVGLIAVIPLLRYVQLQMSRPFERHLMTALMLLCGAAALGSQSRGALLASGAMVLLLWWRGSKNRFTGAIVLTCVSAALVAFMPDTWNARMDTIATYEQDMSAMGRIASWWMAFNAANHNFFGLGMDATQRAWFEIYSPYGTQFGTPVAHSIYFQMLGHHGWVGLILYIAVWVSTWRVCSQLRALGKSHERAAWCGDLGSMVQVSLMGFLVGGAFLNLAYYDMSFNTMLFAVLALNWVKREAWKNEPPPLPVGWGMWRSKNVTPELQMLGTRGSSRA